MLDNEILTDLNNRLGDLDNDLYHLHIVTDEYIGSNRHSATLSLYSDISITDKDTLDSVVEIIKNDCLKKIQADERKIYELSKQYVDFYENREEANGKN